MRSIGYWHFFVSSGVNQSIQRCSVASFESIHPTCKWILLFGNNGNRARCQRMREYETFQRVQIKWPINLKRTLNPPWKSRTIMAWARKTVCLFYGFRTKAKKKSASLWFLTRDTRIFFATLNWNRETKCKKAATEQVKLNEFSFSPFLARSTALTLSQ